MKNIRSKSMMLLLLALITLSGNAQQLKPGFQKSEYRELMHISVQTSGGPDYVSKYSAPTNYKRIYQSSAIGLDNLWDLWVSEDKVAVISIRGTTQKPESWLANFYAAMVPAKGALQINNTDSFAYNLAEHPQAAVHVGWLLSTAYLSREIIPKIEGLYGQGFKEFLIVGHSQGGAIAFLLTSHLNSLQRTTGLPTDIRFKTYCSAAPKPGNLYYAYEYEAMTQGGWGFNVVNAADWVPEVPMSIQTLKDFNPVNPFKDAGLVIRKQKFLKRLALNHAYRQLSKPTFRAQRNYEKYLGKMTSRIIRDNLEGFVSPEYYNSNHYVRTGRTIVLLPDDAYYKQYPNDGSQVFIHHFHAPYLLLLEQLDDSIH